MNLKSRFILKASVGFALGVVVDIIIHMCFILSGDHFLLSGEVIDKSVLLSLYRELFLSGILGLIGNGSAVIYEIESWSILKATVTHFILAFGAFVVIGLMNGWLVLENTVANAISAGAVVLAYVIIWLVQYLIYKREVREINHGIRLLKKQEQGVA